MVTIFALAVIPNSSWPVWLPAAALIGFGMGLRWIGLEPWLYRIAPGNSRGRLVGFHETLIGLAPIIAPVLAAWVGMTGKAPFLLGIAFTGAALIPLAIARAEIKISADSSATFHQVIPNSHGNILGLGVSVALIGGIIEAAFSGLFPIFGAGRSLGTDQMVTLLSIFGLGGLLLQYLVGWLADHRGLVYTTSICAAGTALFAAIASLPLGFSGFAVIIFALGGFITAFLTLAIIAATKAGDGDLSVNVRLVSMVYTSSSILGPLIAGAAMSVFSSEALIWQIAVMASILFGFIIVKGWSDR
jgi:MFS family permease